MNIQKLKRQLRKGRWDSIARNLEGYIAQAGLPLERRVFPSRKSPTVTIEIRDSSGGLAVHDPEKYDSGYKPNARGILKAFLSDGRLIADEEQLYFSKPAGRTGPAPIYDDGEAMSNLSVRLPTSLRERVKRVYPSQSLSVIIRDVLETHLIAIGR